MTMAWFSSSAFVFLGETSNDGKPLIASSISDLLPSNFPYERLSASTSSTAFLRPESVLLLLFFYLVISKPIVKKIQEVLFPYDATTTKKKNKKYPMLQFSIAIHNLGLAVFSLLVAVKTWKIVVIDSLLQYDGNNTSRYDTYCDPKKVLWTTSGFGYWAYVFYVSKYYEFVDTWILILKGKEPSLLQCYHHTGIVFCMWIGIVSHGTSWLVWVVLLNSVIHTIMYTYFFIKTLYPAVHIPYAKYLTTAQITQFFLGIMGSAGVLYLGDECDNTVSRFGLLCLNIYGVGLIALFMAFAKKKYKKN